jgi:hypothetical protein
MYCFSSCRDGRPGRLLCSKLLSYMRPKMHGLLLDTSINSPATVRLNIHQVRHPLLAKLWSNAGQTLVKLISL